MKNKIFISNWTFFQGIYFVLAYFAVLGISSVDRRTLDAIEY